MLNLIIIYQIAQIILLAAAALLINESSAVKWRGRQWVGLTSGLMQFLYVWLVVGYLYLIFTQSIATNWDLVALFLMLLAVLLLMRSVTDKKNCIIDPEQGFKPSGIYRQLRHPVYTALVIYLVAILLIVAIHAELTTGILVALPIAGILLFLYTNAQQEEELMEETCGKSFLVYRYSVYATFPLSYYQDSSEESDLTEQ